VRAFNPARGFLPLIIPQSKYHGHVSFTDADLNAAEPDSATGRSLQMMRQRINAATRRV
jgi:hypothetical protein